MNLTLRGHPVSRMAERGISQEQINVTLDEHDTSYPGNVDERQVYLKRFPDGRQLKVVTLRPIAIGDTETTIVTAAWREE